MARSGGGLNSAAAEQPSDAEQLPLHCITGSRFLGLPFYGKLGCLLGKDCANSWPVLRTSTRLPPNRDANRDASRDAGRDAGVSLLSGRAERS